MDSTGKTIVFVVLIICIYLFLKKLLELAEKNIDNDFQLDMKIKEEVSNKVSEEKKEFTEFTEEEKTEILNESNEVIKNLEDTLEHNIFGIDVDDVENSKE